MTIDSLDDFIKFTKNRYEAVVVASKRARRMNEILIEEEAQIMEGEEEPEKPKMEKIVLTALKEVLDGKVKFERPEKNVVRKF